jgi:diguanylate cyclase (GGDEF)-like protein
MTFPNLTTNSTLDELPSFTFYASPKSLVRLIATELDQHPEIPGVIILDNDLCLGSISRHYIYEQLSRPYGTDVFLNRPLRHLFANADIEALVLPGSMRIDEAVQKALGRSPKKLYDPIIVASSAFGYKLLDFYTLLMAQTQLLNNANSLIQQQFEEIKLLAGTDPLTSIHNRRGFYHLAGSQINMPEYMPVSLLIIDIDHFKRVNDLYGHLMGDQILQQIASECRTCLRENDLLGRYGGEEFVVLLPKTDLEASRLVAERLRYRISQVHRKIKEQDDFFITVSIGIAHSNQPGETLETLIQKADQALYLAKNRGRNRVEIFETMDNAQKSSSPHEISSNISHNELFVPNVQLISPSFIFKKDLESLYDETIRSWVRMLELKDNETENHAQRVAEITVALARCAGMAENKLKDIYRGALLHDIGKIGIPDQILFKPGVLTEKEWDIMRKHPQYAYDLLANIPFLQSSLSIPYYHHEKWDGSGYPHRLKGRDIPLEARLFAVVDVWDALSSDRCYRPAWPIERIFSYMEEQSGLHFDPELLPLCLDFFKCQPIFWGVFQPREYSAV